LRPSELIDLARKRRATRRLLPEDGIRAGGVPEDVPAQPLPTNHANYSRLMRSHDRMGSRHLSKKRI